MNDILSQYVPNWNGEKVTISGYQGYKYSNYIYFIIPDPNNEEIHYQQKAISDYLVNNGFQIATPVLNNQGQLITKSNQKEYIVYIAQQNYRKDKTNHSQVLSNFHQVGTTYPYDPYNISSYGKWKSLWINRIDTFENLYNQYYHERPVSKFKRLFIDMFPYMVGLAENAIQYLQETETERRFHDIDQPTITFMRYSNQLQKEVVWSHELVYDHPARDLAEYIRPLLLNNKPFDSIKTFLSEYEQNRSLSVFSWRLLYARLLFPIHLFDFIEESLVKTEMAKDYGDFNQLLQKQINYEQNLRKFYTELDIDFKKYGIPVIDW